MQVIFPFLHIHMAGLWMVKPYTLSHKITPIRRNVLEDLLALPKEVSLGIKVVLTLLYTNTSTALLQHYKFVVLG